MTLVVESPGLRSLVQDLGRPGLGHIGVSPSGAFDRSALRQVNLVLGNDSGAAALEVLGGGLVLRAEAALWVAVTGGAGAITIDGDPAAYGRAISLRAGQQPGSGTPDDGLRAYVGVAGGFDAPEELGSRSTDTLSGARTAAAADGRPTEDGTPGPSAGPRGHTAHRAGRRADARRAAWPA